MYVNKPLVRLAKRQTNIYPKQESTPVRSKSRPPASDLMLQDKQLDNLELLYELEYKVEKMAGVLSVGLEEVASVTVLETHEEDLQKSRQLVEAAIKKQIKREMDVLSKNQLHKARLEAYTQEITKAIAASKKIVVDLKEGIKANESILKLSKEKQDKTLQVQRQLENALGQRSRLITNYRQSQQRLQKLRQDTSQLDSQIFSKQQQLEQLRRDAENYRINLQNISQYSDLERYRKRIFDEYNNKAELFQKMSKQRIDEIVAIRTNIAKIEEMAKGIHAELYEQRCFLRVGEQERIYRKPESEDQEDTEVYKPVTELGLAREYEEMYLPPIEDKWGKYKSKLSRYFSEKQNPQPSAYDHFQRHKSNPRSLTQNSSNQEDDYDEVRPMSLRKRKHKDRHRTEEVTDRRNQQQKLKSQSNNTVRLTLKTKKQAQMIRSGRQRLQLESLYSRKSDHLKNKIASHLKHKKATGQNTVAMSRQRKKRKEANSDSMQLVSVGESQNDSRYQYVQVELSKEQLAALNKK